MSINQPGHACAIYLYNLRRHYSGHLATRGGSPFGVWSMGDDWFSPVIIYSALQWLSFCCVVRGAACGYPTDHTAKKSYEAPQALRSQVPISHWNYLKRGELGNVCCRDLDHLSAELIRARERLRHKRGIIRSCSQQCGYWL